MDTKTIILLVIGIILINLIIFFIIGVSIIYNVLFVRTNKEKWSHTCSMKGDEECEKMFALGQEFYNTYKDNEEDVYIKNEGLNLFGQYYDFGSDKCVIILPGRMESCIYSNYYASPYKDAGYNVLTIDNRAHGLSDGKINSLGYKEYKDVLMWAKYLHEEKKIETIVLHGICIGSSTAIFTLTSDNCPAYIKGMVADGMYIRFKESCLNHMLEQKRPIFPFFPMLMMHIRIFSGADVINDGPLFRMGKLDRPILFLHSKEDIYSTPDLAKKLYDTCNSEKEIVWFDKGGHSRVRINNQEKYDKSINNFLNKL